MRSGVPVPSISRACRTLISTLHRLNLLICLSFTYPYLVVFLDSFFPFPPQWVLRRTQFQPSYIRLDESFLLSSLDRLVRSSQTHILDRPMRCCRRSWENMASFWQSRSPASISIVFQSTVLEISSPFIIRIRGHVCPLCATMARAGIRKVPQVTPNPSSSAASFSADITTLYMGHVACHKTRSEQVTTRNDAGPSKAASAMEQHISTITNDGLHLIKHCIKLSRMPWSLTFDHWNAEHSNFKSSRSREVPILWGP